MTDTRHSPRSFSFFTAIPAALLFSASFALILLVGAVPTVAQDTGFPPFSSFQNTDFDSVNLANLNVHFAVPVVQKAGHGTPFHYILSYDGLIWTPGPTWTPVTNWGWRGISEALSGYVTYTTQGTYCTLPNGHLYSHWTYHDPSGTVHSFNGHTTDCDGGPDHFIATSSDRLSLLSG